MATYINMAMPARGTLLLGKVVLVAYLMERSARV